MAKKGSTVKKIVNKKNTSSVIKKNSKKKNVQKKNTSKTRIVKKDSLINSKGYKLAEKLYKNKEYEKAYEEYYSLSKEFSKNKKIYKRLLECLTHDFTYKESSKEFKRAMDDYVTTYKILATKKELKIFEIKLSEYRKIKYSNSKSKFLIIALLGFLGLHKFIEKKYIMGILYILTLGFFGVGIIIDLINDYAMYENDVELNIFRYIISFAILVFGLFMIDKTANFYYFIIVAILSTPLIYSTILRLIPGIIKIIAIIILIYFGFKVEPVIEYVPTNILGKWITSNENTNYKELNIKLNETIIKFNDRDKVSGINTYDKENGVLNVKVDEKTTYRFKIDFDNNKICTYNESKKCLIAFESKK